MNNQIYRILACNLPALEDEFRKLGKKAKKLGLEAPSYSIIEYIPEFIDRLAVPNEVIPARYEISVSGEFPKLPGWTFVGTIEHTEHGNVLRSMPDQEVPEEYRTADPTCDHCQTKRRRKDTFLILNESGELKRVGRSCVKDYLGGKSPEQIAYSAGILKALSDMDDEPKSSSGKSGYDIRGYLSWCVACIEHDGYYVSKSKSLNGGGESTSSKALNEMNKRKDPDFKPTKEDMEEALELLDWIRNIDPKNSFETNLKIVAQKDLLELRDLGFVACIPVTYKKMMEGLEAKKNREDEKKQRMDRLKDSVHFGTIGKREYFNLQFKHTVAFDGFYGRTFIHMFEDSNGNAAIWKTCNASPVVVKESYGDFLEPFVKDQWYELKATVKEHGEYNGINQTALKRVNVEPVIKENLNICGG